MTRLLDSELGRLRIVSLLEGTSYLVLVGFAVPMKYWMGSPAFVHVVGRVHGGLFVLFLIAVARVAVSEPWGWARVLRAVAAAMVPFGAFWFERRLRTERS
jgi:integral membrane protein